MPPLPPPAIVEWPADLLREHGFQVAAHRIEVCGRAYEVGPSSEVEAAAHEPRAFGSLVLLCLGAMTVPFTLQRTPPWLVGVPICLMLLAGARLLTAQTSYRVVLVTKGKERTLFESDDQRLVIALTAAVRAALEGS